MTTKSKMDRKDLNNQTEKYITKISSKSEMYKNDWNNGLFGCFQNFNLCLANFFCFPCIFGKLADKSGFGKGILLTIVIILIYMTNYAIAVIWRYIRIA